METDTDLITYALNARGLNDADKKRQKQKSIFSASLGFLLLLVAVLPLVFFGDIGMSQYTWFMGLALTGVIWSIFYMAVVLGLDRLVAKFDPHFVFYPAAGAAVNISLFVYLAPEIRIMALGGWFTVILFGGALLRHKQLLALSIIMGLLYISAIIALFLGGYPLDLFTELAQVIPFWAFWLYSGRVTDRMRARREENRVLRDKLAHLAFTDSLTGLDNRRAFESKLDQTLDSLKPGRSIAVIVFDLDNFKRINDERGHLAGDQVLSHVSNTLKQLLVNYHSLARMGGDEFAVIIDVNNLEELDQKLKEFWTRFNATTSGQYTTSGGAVFCDKKVTSARCMRIADTALYEAKASGRNCFRIIDLDDIDKAMSKRKHR